MPGSLAYWAAQGAAAAATVGLAVAGRRLWQRLDAGSFGPLGVPPEAGFARRHDLDRLAVRRPEPGRLTLGTCGGRLLAVERDTSLAVIGPTGCGKTAGFAIPALLEWEGPVIATSVKADLLEATIAHRGRRGRVWVYDPSSASGHATSGWSPLASCDTWQGALRTAAWMIEAAQPRVDTVNDPDYWYTQGRKALAPYLLAAATSGRTLADIVRWVDVQDNAETRAALLRAIDQAVHQPGVERHCPSPSRWDDLWQASIEVCRQTLRTSGETASWADEPIQHWPRTLAEQVAAIAAEEWLTELTAAPRGPQLAGPDAVNPTAPLTSAQALWAKEPRLRGSVYATAENVLESWADPGVLAAAQRHDIDPVNWLAGDNTIYVVAPAHEQARLRPVLTVLVQLAVRTAYDTANRNGGRLPHPCLVLLDEAGNIAPLRDLPAYAATARSHGISLVTVWQDLSQVQAVFGQRAQTVLNNHRAKLFGSGIADANTLDYVSRIIGDEARTDTNISAELHGGRRSISEHNTYRRAAPADVVRRIRPDRGVLIYGSELPIHLRLRPWFRAPGLRRTANRPDLTTAPERRTRRARLRRRT
jgi:type IV secretion system protein VirD4